jgi:glycosyltransferase involved in cell wall biosynthesis
LARAAIRRLSKVARDIGLGSGLSRARAKRLISQSGLFNADWYRRTYTCASEVPDPLSYYLDRGAAMGHNPSPLFWTAWYAQAHPGSQSFAGGALCHYLTGRGSFPNPVFDDGYYRTQSGKTDDEVPLAHYVRVGWRLGYNPHPLFDTGWYLKALGEADCDAGGPLSHFLDRGGLDGLKPCPYFDSANYLARYPDVASAGVNPLAHFLMGGVRDLRDPSVDFCTARYLRGSPEARASHLNPLVHAIQEGRAVDPPEPLAGQPTGALSYRPRITAIVPNFNHAAYLAERLDSILGQTLLPDEIIFLDDCSSDNSLEIAKRYKDRSPIPIQIVPNDRNSGSPFSQWAKGIAMVQDGLVWMAESDDRCAPEFLRTVCAPFVDSTVSMSYCQSRPVDSTGRPLARDYRDYTDDLSLERWQTAYTAEGNEEVLAALAHKNTIPNGSAVLFRKESVLPMLAGLPSYRQCGDWYLYLACAAAGRIAFTPAVLNDHRRHASALTISLTGSLDPLDEAFRIRLETIRRFDLPDSVFLSSVAAIASEFCSRTISHAQPWPKLETENRFSRYLDTLKQEISTRFGRTDRSLRIVGSLQRIQAGQGFVILARPLADNAPDKRTDEAVWLEGTPCVTAWSMPTLWMGNAPWMDQRRIAIIGTLVDLYGIGSISAEQGEPFRLASAVAVRCGIPITSMP